MPSPEFDLNTTFHSSIPVTISPSQPPRMAQQQLPFLSFQRMPQHSDPRTQCFRGVDIESAPYLSPSSLNPRTDLMKLAPIPLLTPPEFCEVLPSSLASLKEQLQVL